MSDGQPAVSTSGRGGAGSGSSAPTNAQRQLGPAGNVHPIVQYGCTAGFFGVAGTIVAGVYGTLSKNQPLYARMLRTRIILVGTTLGLYVSGTGFIPVPAPLTTVFGPPTRLPPQ